MWRVFFVGFLLPLAVVVVLILLIVLISRCWNIRGRVRDSSCVFWGQDLVQYQIRLEVTGVTQVEQGERRRTHTEPL